MSLTDVHSTSEIYMCKLKLGEAQIEYAIWLASVGKDLHESARVRVQMNINSKADTVNEV